mmetsp:Transcript_11026/g.27775  ORF Transcript_11026/g.27775 Transcript_11026/m.27775 type:complete len:258 (-) Transcript_11026:220-993(-)
MERIHKQRRKPPHDRPKPARPPLRVPLFCLGHCQVILKCKTPRPSALEDIRYSRQPSRLRARRRLRTSPDTVSLDALRNIHRKWRWLQHDHHRMPAGLHRHDLGLYFDHALEEDPGPPAREKNRQPLPRLHNPPHVIHVRRAVRVRLPLRPHKHAPAPGHSLHHQSQIPRVRRLLERRRQRRRQRVPHQCPRRGPRVPRAQHSHLLLELMRIRVLDEIVEVRSRARPVERGVGDFGGGPDGDEVRAREAVRGHGGVE